MEIGGETTLLLESESPVYSDHLVNGRVTNQIVNHVPAWHDLDIVTGCRQHHSSGGPRRSGTPVSRGVINLYIFCRVQARVVNALPTSHLNGFSIGHVFSINDESNFLNAWSCLVIRVSLPVISSHPRICRSGFHQVKSDVLSRTSGVNVGHWEAAVALVSVLVDEFNLAVSGYPFFRQRVGHFCPVKQLLSPPDIVPFASHERHGPSIDWILFILERKNSIVRSFILP